MPVWNRVPTGSSSLLLLLAVSLLLPNAKADCNPLDDDNRRVTSPNIKGFNQNTPFIFPPIKDFECSLGANRIRTNQELSFDYPSGGDKATLTFKVNDYVSDDPDDGQMQQFVSNCEGPFTVMRLFGVQVAFC